MTTQNPDRTLEEQILQGIKALSPRDRRLFACRTIRRVFKGDQIHPKALRLVGVAEEFAIHRSDLEGLLEAQRSADWESMFEATASWKAVAWCLRNNATQAAEMVSSICAESSEDPQELATQLADLCRPTSGI